MSVMEKQTEVPVACSLTQADRVERGKRWRQLAAQAPPEVAATERGLRLTFRGEPGVDEELRELAALERVCCAFADWTVTAADGQVVLDVEGDGAEAVAAVRAMFEF